MARRDNPGIEVLMAVLPPQLPREPEADVVSVWIAGKTISLRPIWIGQGFPSDVHRALDKVSRDATATPVITARRLSSGAKQLLTERQISWADAAGHAEIADPAGLYVARLRPKPLPQSATTGIAWSRSVEVVAEYVLSRRSQMLRNAEMYGIDRVAHIAEATNVSSAQVSKALVMFDEEGYTAKFGAERGPTSVRQFASASRFLSDWAGHYARAPRKDRRVELHVPWRSHTQSIALAANVLRGIPWAISGWAAADAIAPYATQVPDLTVYVPDNEIDQALTRLTELDDVTEVDRGGRIHLRSAERYLFEFTTRSDFAPAVSPVRVYADLIRTGDRGTEAAEHLREVAIGY